MTKLHEEVVRTTLSEAAVKYAETPPKGEIVLVIEGAKPEEKQPAELPIEQARQLIEQGMSVRDAARLMSTETGCSRSELYRELIR
jgi:16S rRNA (cytidine1402-2'-O)-methyltransferase